MSYLKIDKIKYQHFKPHEKSLRRDGIFQTVLGNQLFKEPLKDLLECILGEKIEELEVIPEKHSMVTRINQKEVRFDLFVICDKNNYLDIEMQNRNWYNDINRLDVNINALYSEATSKGEKISRDYGIKAKAIVFLDYNEFEDGPYHEILSRSRESNNEKVTDNLEYHIIQMPKFFEQVKEIKTKKEAWIAYLSNQLNKDQLEVLFKMDENIRDLDKLAQDVIDDEELMHEINYKIRMKALEKIESEGINKHMEEFIEDIKEQEKYEEKKKTQIEIAKEMLRDNVDIEKIMQYSKLSKEEVERIKKKLETEK